MENTRSAKEIVRLEKYNPSYRENFDHYFLSEDQVKYTAHPLHALTVCEKDPLRIPVVILYDDVPCGFFVLHGWEGVKEYFHNQKAVLLRAYSVETSFQGKGIAQASLRMLPDFVKATFPEANEIILAVNHGNITAQHVYKKCGYIDKGIRAMGINGEMFIYHLPFS